MLQESLGGESSANAKKALAKVQKMLQIASTKRNALARRDYFETLEECLKSDASIAMKVLGYRLASKLPSCTTLEIWQLLLETCVTELAGSQNAPLLLYALPLLEHIPLPLVLSFLISSEREVMNKFRAVLTHEQSDVRCSAITSLSKLVLDVASSITNDRLYTFPFESHEARICCQQDVWILVIDTWKLILQAIFLEGSQNVDVVGTAFAAMKMLFARSSAMAQFNFAKEPSRTQSAMNDVTSAIFKEVFPRIRAVISTAQALPMKYQSDAILWIAMLLYMMMERTGARCASVSVPYLEIDIVISSDPHSKRRDDDDDDNQRSTHRVRMDQLASDLLESWICPLFSRKASLAQATNICRAVFVLISHPLQEFTRLKWAGELLQQLIAQCYFNKGVSVKLEMSVMAIKTFAWLKGRECLVFFVRTVETLSLMERETDRRDLIQALMDSICDRVIESRDFLLLESLCSIEFMKQPESVSRLSPRTNSPYVLRALIQSLVQRPTPSDYIKEIQVAQLITLKALQGAILMKPTSTATMTSDQIGSISSTLPLCYMGLMVSHFHNLLRFPDAVMRESLQFVQHDVQIALSAITSSNIRIQLLWIAVQVSRVYQIVPLQKLLDQLTSEIHHLTNLDRSKDAEHEADPTIFTFDDGKLGGSGTSSANYRGTYKKSDSRNAEILIALTECINLMGQIHPQFHSYLQKPREQLRLYITDTFPDSLLEEHLVEELMAITSTHTTDRMYSQEIFDPQRIFIPRKQYLTQLEFIQALEDELFREPVVVTGSSDPLSLQILYYHPVPEHEDIISLVVSCCNLTNLALSDFEIHICPLAGTARCIDNSNDTKLRLLQGGNASGGLPPFGVFKGERRFQVQKFTKTSFVFRVVFQETDSSSNGDDQQPMSMKLAYTDPFILHFDVFCRHPEPQFKGAAFFQHVWQSAESSVLLSTESLPSTADSTNSHNSNQLAFCQRLLKLCKAKIAVITELLVDLPIHIHIAYLTKTRWGDYVAASLTLTIASPVAKCPQWTGILELRGTATHIHELRKAPRDVITMFCGDCLQLSNTTGPTVSIGTPAALLHSGSRTSSRIATSALSSPTDFPTSADFTLNQKNTPFASPFDAQTEQLRTPTATSFAVDPWGM